MKKTELPQIKIDAPKNQTKLTQGKSVDLSDHFPIITEIDGIKIVSYNLQLIHTLFNAEGKRNATEMKLAAQEFSDYFKRIDADVCCVQELFDSTANKAMDEAMRQNGYITTEREGSNPFLNGGIKFFIKKKLATNLQSNQHVYRHSIDYFRGDGLINKGVAQVSFNKDNKTYHVFNTHLQAQYAHRDHYEEVTLAQCIELKYLIEKQRTQGFIKPNDTVILCGDFNISKPNINQQGKFLYTKMTNLMGPRFTFLDYANSSENPKYTRSNENTHFSSKIKVDIYGIVGANLDMIGIYTPPTTDPSESDSDTKFTTICNEILAAIYSKIQLNITDFVSKSTTIFSLWALPPKKTLILNELNQKFKQLIIDADEIKKQNNNPIGDTSWVKQANELLELSYLAVFSVDNWRKTFNPEHGFIKWPQNASIANRIFGIPPNKSILWISIYLLTFQWLTIPAKNLLSLITEYPLTVISDTVTSTLDQLKASPQWYAKIAAALFAPLSLSIRATRFLVRMITSPVALGRELQHGKGRWNSVLYGFYGFAIIPMLATLIIILPAFLLFPLSIIATVTTLLLGTAVLAGVLSEGSNDRLSLLNKSTKPVSSTDNENKDSVQSSYQYIMDNKLKPSTPIKHKEHRCVEETKQDKLFKTQEKKTNHADQHQTLVNKQPK